MKNFLLLFFLVLSVGATCFSQSLSLTFEKSQVENGAQVVQSGPSDTLQLITWLRIKNNAANTLRVMMKKEEISVLPGTSSSICWAGYCYGPMMMVSTEPLVMIPGDTLSGCFAHFGPDGCRGVSVIRWTFFNEADPSDSISITVQYSTFPSSNSDRPGLHYVFSIARLLPAGDQVIANYSLPPGKEGRLELRNPSGRIVSASGPVNLSGSFVFNTSTLLPGLYFCTLVISERPVTTRKILVCR